jgi:hypothetical protein
MSSPSEPSQANAVPPPRPATLGASKIISEIPKAKIKGKPGLKPGHKPYHKGEHLKEYQFKKGQSGNPQGRRLDRISKYSEDQLKEIASRYGITPLEFMVACIRDPAQTMDFRLDAAVAAAPYMHRRMPIGIDNGSGGPVGFYTAEQLAKLTDDQLEQLKKAVELLASVANPQPIPIDVTPTKILGNGS